MGLQIGSKAHRIYSLLCPPHLAPSFLHMHMHIHAEAPEVKHLLPNLKKENKITGSYSKENKPLLWGNTGVRYSYHTAKPFSLLWDLSAWCWLPPHSPQTKQASGQSLPSI